MPSQPRVTWESLVDGVRTIPACGLDTGARLGVLNVRRTAPQATGGGAVPTNDGRRNWKKKAASCRP